MPLRFCAWSFQGEGEEGSKAGKIVTEKQDLKELEKNKTKKPQVHCKVEVTMISFAFHKDLFFFRSGPLFSQELGTCFTGSYL